MHQLKNSTGSKTNAYASAVLTDLSSLLFPSLLSSLFPRLSSHHYHLIFTASSTPA